MISTRYPVAPQPATCEHGVLKMSSHRSHGADHLFVEDCAVVRSRTDLQHVEVDLTEPDPLVDTLVVNRVDGQQTPLTVRVVGTRSRVGPPKLWFLCPKCDRRVGCLYSPSSREPFACRICCDLKYRSQYQRRKYKWLFDLLRRPIGEVGSGTEKRSGSR